MNIKPLETINFSRNEAACKCGCGFDAQDWELLEVLEGVRAFFQKPVIVNSWCRCEDYNRKIGGAGNSQHVKAKAADIRIHGIPTGTVADYLEATYKDRYGIGRYDLFTHIDVRPTEARLDKTTKP